MWLLAYFGASDFCLLASRSLACNTYEYHPVAHLKAVKLPIPYTKIQEVKKRHKALCLEKLHRFAGLGHLGTISGGLLHVNVCRFANLFSSG